MAVLIISLVSGCGLFLAVPENLAAPENATLDSPPEALAPGSITMAELETCHDHPRLRCGTMRLPLERAEPRRGEIDVAFAVRPRDDRGSPSQGAIVAIEGGPGYGSIDSAPGYVATFGSLLRHRELILVDARGAGSSQPIDCPDLHRERVDDELGVARCAEQLGTRWDSFRTSAAADDINDVRAALGYERVQMYGDSYGTFLAQSYAFRHGDTLEALVLDSAFPVRGESPWYPSLWATGIQGLTTACDRSPTCHGDARRRLDRFVALQHSRGEDIGPLLDAISAAGYSTPENYLDIDQAISDYLAGYERSYRELTAPGRRGFGAPGKYSVGQEMAISCNDYPMIWDKNAPDPDRRRQLADAIAAYPQDAFAPFTAEEIVMKSDYSYRECLGAPRPGDLYEPPAPQSATAPDIPVLVVAGELDNVTSPAEAEMTAALFPNSELFLWRNAGHVQSLNSPYSAGAITIRRFLRAHVDPGAVPDGDFAFRAIR